MKKKALDLDRDQVCRLIGILAMMVWSAVMLWFYASGRLQAYIRPEYLRLACLGGGLGLGALSVFNLLHLRDRGSCEDCGHDHDHAHGHEHPEHAQQGCGHEHGACEHGQPSEHEHAHQPHGTSDQGHDHEEWDTSLTGNVAMFLVMVIPVLAAAAYSKDGYTSASTIWNKGLVEDTTAVARRVEQDLNQAAQAKGAEKKGDDAGAKGKGGSWEYTLADLEKVVDRSPGGNLILTVDQLFYTSGDAELQRVLEGQAVEAVGQVIPYDPKTPHPKRLRVFTLMVTCCAADAQPVSIPMEFAGGVPAFEEMSWVKVSGTMSYPKEGSQVIPLLKVKAMVPTEQPYNDAVY